LDKIESIRSLEEAVLETLPSPPPTKTTQGESSMREIVMEPIPQPAQPAAPPPPAAIAKPSPLVTQPMPADLSVAELEAALKKEPANFEIMRKLGKKLQQSGRARDGEKHLARSLEIDPQNIENHFAMAEFYLLQGLKIKSFKHLNIILQLEP